MISDAVDLLVQIGIRHEIRRVIAISNVAKDLMGKSISMVTFIMFHRLLKVLTWEPTISI